MDDLAKLIMQGLNVGGDAATIAVALGLWRLDRRVIRIESYLFEGRGSKK